MLTLNNSKKDWGTSNNAPGIMDRGIAGPGLLTFVVEQQQNSAAPILSTNVCIYLEDWRQ